MATSCYLEKLKNYNISATARPILMKFGTMIWDLCTLSAIKIPGFENQR